MNLNKREISWLIIDWGTTNFRVFAMDANNDVVDKKEEKLGLLQVKEGGFAKQLEEILSGWLAEFKSLPIFMAGMVGSKQGWHDVNYQATPVDLINLASTAYQFLLPWGASAVIFPGVSHQSNGDQYDVMRGEEIQLIGLSYLLESTSFLSILPGTHSKHAVMKNGKLSSFSTYMTGELYSILSQYSILGRGLSELPQPHELGKAFIRGLNEGQSGLLSNALFLVRTHRLFNNLSDDQVLEYLSGMLIGKELSALKNTMNETDEHLYLVGSENLCRSYQLACSEFGIKNTYVNGDNCFIRGMIELKKVINNVKK